MKQVVLLVAVDVMAELECARGLVHHQVVQHRHQAHLRQVDHQAVLLQVEPHQSSAKIMYRNVHRDKVMFVKQE